MSLPWCVLLLAGTSSRVAGTAGVVQTITRRVGCVVCASGESRYNWAHEIVSDPDGRGVAFKDRHVHRERRISIMFRDEK